MLGDLKIKQLNEPLPSISATQQQPVTAGSTSQAQEDNNMVQTSRSKSKSKQPQKQIAPSSLPSSSKEPIIFSDNPSSSKTTKSSSAEQVSSHVRNHNSKTNYVWRKKDVSKPSASSTFSPTEYTALPSVTTSNGKETSFGPALPAPSSPSSSRPSDRSSPPSSPKLRPTLKQIQPPIPLDGKQQPKKVTYSLHEKDSLPIFKVPKHIRNLINKDIVPRELKHGLSPSSYRNYFSALLYAEELYLQKWSKFKMLDVELDFHDATIHTWWKRKKNDKVFVVFDMDSIKERRPFLLSRDIVYARPSGSGVQPFEGIVYRVVTSIHVLVDFEDDFHIQHRPNHRYDINFSFNRICFRRAHQAIRATTSPFFPKLSYLFPDFLSGKSVLSGPAVRSMRNTLDADQLSVVDDILGIECPPPYLVEGQLCVTSSRSKEKKLSRTGDVVREAVYQIYRSSPEHQILICSPLNATCDELMLSLKKVIPEYEMFRANAAFREVNVVPTDILSSCPYDGECFTCPSSDQLHEFRIILSTFVSCFRLHKEGLAAGHFSHVFIVDASAGTEPETMIALANFADENTAVVITGSTGSAPYLVRSDMARRKGLKTSYFERLRNNFSSSHIHEQT